MYGWLAVLNMSEWGSLLGCLSFGFDLPLGFCWLSLCLGFGDFASLACVLDLLSSPWIWLVFSLTQLTGGLDALLSSPRIFGFSSPWIFSLLSSLVCFLLLGYFNSSP